MIPELKQSHFTLTGINIINYQDLGFLCCFKDQKFKYEITSYLANILLL